ncbi:hypothetical protein BHE74_00032595 [Ensete ventricosum]|nr:hypothetical protein BHE74_00032595 [Ensete ventricosum]
MTPGVGQDNLRNLATVVPVPERKQDHVGTPSSLGRSSKMGDPPWEVIVVAPLFVPGRQKSKSLEMPQRKQWMVSSVGWSNRPARALCSRLVGAFSPWLHLWVRGFLQMVAVLILY